MAHLREAFKDPWQKTPHALKVSSASCVYYKYKTKHAHRVVLPADIIWYMLRKKEIISPGYSIYIDKKRVSLGG